MASSDTVARPAPTVDDPARVSALADVAILDTAPEQGFDDVVRLATRLCAAPVALVSFVASDRQWFKARIGFPACETDLDRSVCKFVLAEPDILQIPDLAADPRTRANPLVTGAPGIRFYAGAPLRSPDGHTLGSLCVIDTAPRPAGLTADQAEDLRALARQVAGLLAMRWAVEGRDAILARQQDELRQARRLDVLAKTSAALLGADDPAAALHPILTEGASALGIDMAFLYDVALDGCHLRLAHAVNTAADVRARLERRAFGDPACGVVAATRRPLVLSHIQANTDPDHDLSRELGLDAYAGYPVMSRGELCGVIAFGTVIEPAFDAETLEFFETLARLMAAVYERLDGEAELAEVGAYWRSLFERLSEAFVVGEVVRDGSGRVVDWRYVEVNNAWGDLVGIESRTALGRTVRAVLPGIEDAWIEDFARVVETGEPTAFLRRIGSLDRWYEGRAFALGPERFATVFLEVTDRVRAETLRAALVALADRLNDLASIPEMTRAAAEIVGTTLDATRAGFGRVDAAIEIVDIDSDWTAPGVASIAGRHRFADFGRIRDDLAQGRPLVIEDVRTDPRTRDDPGPMIALGIGALVNMPVQDRGRTVAVFIVQDAGPRAWPPEALAFLRSVADRLEAGVARVKAEADQRILNEELSHRLKNTLAMVISIAGQTLRSVPDRAPVEAFEKRIHALSKAHDVLLRQSWAAAPAREVVRAVLAGAGQADRVAVSGPELDLGPRATLSLSMLVHELATNAAKYGALSVPEGRVDVVWRLAGEAEGREAILDWTERDGPVPTPPATSGRRGFGSRLIQMGLVGTGGVDLRFPATGFQATMRAPLVQLQQS